MEKLKLGFSEDDKPVKATVEFPAATWRKLQAYAEILGREHRQTVPEPTKLVPAMVDRFMATDRVFTKRRKQISTPSSPRSGPEAKTE